MDLPDGGWEQRIFSLLPAAIQAVTAKSDEIDHPKIQMERSARSIACKLEAVKVRFENNCFALIVCNRKHHCFLANKSDSVSSWRDEGAAIMCNKRYDEDFVFCK